MIGALCAVALTAAIQDPARDPRAGPDRRVELDFEHYYAPDELAVALRSLADAYPEILSLESIGASRGGRPIWLVTAAQQGGPDPLTRPAVFVAAGASERDLFGTEVALRVVATLAEDRGRDERIARVLGRATIYVVPCVDPDLRARVLERLGGAPEAETAARADLERNFPIGWDPLGGAGSGGYPLSEPESRALAEFLVARPGIAVVETLGWERPPHPAPADASELDLAAHDALCAPGRLQSALRLADARGSLLEFGYGQLGAFAFHAATPLADSKRAPLPDVRDLYDLARTCAPRTIELADALARLEVTSVDVEPLGADTWQVDLAIENRGLLPTASDLARRRAGLAEPALEIAGPRVLAAAFRRRGSGAYEPLASIGPSIALGELAAGGSVGVRLVVAAPAGSALEATARAPRASRASARIELR